VLKKESQPVLIADILMKYCDNFPDGKEKAGKKRGFMTLTTFLHEHSVKRSKTKRRAKSIWDWELFTTQMKFLRGWLPERCEKEWHALVMVPENVVDKQGSTGLRPERIRVPAWMIGSEQELSDEEVAETKTLQTHSKAAGMTEEARTQLRSEMTSGFSSLRSMAPPSDLSQPLHAGAMSYEGHASEVTGLGLLAAALQKACPAKADHLSEASTASTILPSPVKGTPEKNKEGEPPSVFDLRAARSASNRSKTQEVQQADAKLTKFAGQLGKALTSHVYLEGDDEYDTAFERLQVLLMFLNKAPSVANDTAGKPTVDFDALKPFDVKYWDESAGKDMVKCGFDEHQIKWLKHIEAKNKAASDAKSLEASKGLPADASPVDGPTQAATPCSQRCSKYAALLELPVECVETMMSIPALIDTTNQLKNVESQEVLLKLNEVFEAQKTLQGQFLKCLKTSLKDT
jgi:hypothetical protein